MTQTESMLPDPRHAATTSQDWGIFSAYRRSQVIHIAMAVLGWVIFSALAGLIHFPAHAGYEASIFQQPWPIMPLLTIAVVFIAFSLLAARILRKAAGLAPLSGLFGAAIGLASWSVRGGAISDVLFRADSLGTGAAVFIHLILEVILLFAIVAPAWWILIRTAAPTEPDSPDGFDSSIGMKLLALVGQVAIMGLGTFLLARTAEKQQVLIGVGVAALASTFVIESFLPLARMAPWYWAGPLIVAVAGYSLAWFDPAGFSTGHLLSDLGALARPLPLDYASVGVAGAVVGMLWARHHDPREA